MKTIIRAFLLICLMTSASDVFSQSTTILFGGEETELSPEGVITGRGSSQFGGLGAALLDTFNIYYQPLGEGDFQDNLFPDPEVYSFQMNIPEGLLNYQSQGIHGSFWDSRGRENEGVLPWINEEWREGRYYDARYLPAGDESPFGLVSDSVQWTIDYWDVDEEDEICFIHTCLSGVVEDFNYIEETGDATALLVTLQTAYLGYGEDGEPGPGAVEYDGGVYQGFDSFRERSGLLDYPAYFFEYDGETNEGSLTPCGTKVIVTGEDGVKGYFDTIQAGIDASEDGDTVLVAPGEYQRTTINVPNIVLGSLILTTGQAEYIDSTIITDDNGPLMTVSGNGALIRGFTIRDGNGGYAGGGIDCRDTPIFEDIVVTDCYADQLGGGASIRSGHPVFVRCKFINNGRRGGSFTRRGGAICLERGGTAATLEQCVISDNHAGGGGGIYVFDNGELNLNQVLFADNSVPEPGIGSALFLISAAATLNKVTMVNNIAPDENAGALHAMQNCNITINNSIFFDSTDPQIAITDGNTEGDIDYCNIEGGIEGINIPEENNIQFGDNNINEDPMFIDPDEGDFHLNEDSPCIDTGDPDSPEDPDGTRADMGAYYFHQEVQDDDGVLHVPDEYETIQQAIDTAEDADTVLVASGEYVENINFEGKAIIVIGNPDNPSEVIIDGDSSGIVVTFANEETKESQLIGFTLTNGVTDENGGGIICTNSSPIIYRCRIIGNSAQVSGGGLYVNGECTPVFERCEISNNDSWQTGGGISITMRASPIFRNCLMTGNVTQEDGHTAICRNESSLCLINCTISQNGVAWEHPHGSIFCSGSEVILLNTISFENFIAEVRFDQWGEASRAIISHSNIDGVSTNDNGEVISEGGNIDENPLFADVENGDFHLTEDSPCIDAGTAFFVWEDDTLLNLSEDEYNHRAPDMGGFESEYENIVEKVVYNPEEFILYSAYPNPFNSTIQIQYSAPLLNDVNFILFDIAGRSVFNEKSGIKSPGLHSFEIQAGNLPSGLYILQMKTEHSSLFQKITLLK